ncbi:predicted protein [Botrytis cinerea T4]|uniref:Uncharacterized protein n=1 Tax=Botryotinia fuckeliana (strain T4) TaxID=999810 RepID=G2YIX7_BOTF4|nr:predicted protein [Botrytis cinerea T4]
MSTHSSCMQYIHRVRSIADCALYCVIAYRIPEFIDFGRKLLPNHFSIVIFPRRMRGTGLSRRGSPMNLDFPRLLEVDPRIPILVSVAHPFARRTIFRS